MGKKGKKGKKKQVEGIPLGGAGVTSNYGDSGGASGSQVGGSKLAKVGDPQESTDFMDLMEPDEAGLMDLMEPDEEVVQVVYVEEPLKLVKFVPRKERISDGWLKKCVQESHACWSDHLPKDVTVSDLEGRIVPEDALVFSDLALEKGTVLVELKEAHLNKGLVAHCANSNARLLEVEERNEKRFQDLEQRLADCHNQFEARLEGKLESRVADMEVELRQCLTSSMEMKMENEVLRRQNEELEVTCKASLELGGKLQKVMKKGLELSNKVKKSHALTLARLEVEKKAGRAKLESETWHSFIKSLTATELQRAGVEKSLVRELLAHGAHEFNESIHYIPPEEVVGSIAFMPHGSLRLAWEEVFFLAFGKSVTDELFKDELDYAAEQRELLEY